MDERRTVEDYLISTMELAGNPWIIYENHSNWGQYDSYWDNVNEPPYLQNQWPKQEEREPDFEDIMIKSMEMINSRLETLETQFSNLVILMSQEVQESLPTKAEPNLDVEAQVITLRSGKELKEELKHEGRTSIERDEALTEGSIHVENEIDLVFPNTEKKKEVPIFLGQTLLAIGDVVIEVQKGMVTLRCGKEEDVLKDPMKKILTLQHPSILVGCEKTKMSSSFEAHPPHGKRKNHMNQMVGKLRRGNAIKVKFALGEPPD